MIADKNFVLAVERFVNENVNYEKWGCNYIFCHQGLSPIVRNYKKGLHCVSKALCQKTLDFCPFKFNAANLSILGACCVEN
jgi:hypothetical protein